MERRQRELPHVARRLEWSRLRSRIHLIELGDICGADTSRVTTKQRFVGVSRQEVFRKFGVWYESHPAGAKMQRDLNAEIEMGLTEPWPDGTRDT